MSTATVATPAKIATVIARDSATAQALIAKVVADWRAAGANIVGVIAEPHGIPGRTCGAGILREIVSRKSFPIYLDTAPSHTSCHLDATGVDGACAAILNQIATSDLVVLSKFGKLEASGGGLAPAFEAAIAAGKPLLTTVSYKHRDTWRALVAHATVLNADKAALENWWRAMQSSGGSTRATGTPRRDDAAVRHDTH